MILKATNTGGSLIEKGLSNSKKKPTDGVMSALLYSSSVVGTGARPG
jgi:hypothetical protein